MLNPFQEVNWRPGSRERRRFAASLIAGFPCVAAILLVGQRWHGGVWNFGPALTLGGAGVALGTALWLAPRLARPFYVVWHGAACAIGFVAGNALLAAVFLLVLAPLGIVRRAFGRPAFARNFDRRATTYWHDAPKPAAPGRYFRQF